MFIKAQVMNGAAMNFCLLVPTKALINEVYHKMTDDLQILLESKNYTVVTSPGSLALEKERNFIFVLTPERLLYLLIGRPDIRIDYLFVDEAHKISAEDSRSTFYYKVVDMLAQRVEKPHVIFSSPNIPNPEIYLRLIPDVMEECKKGLVTSYSPVSQVKFFLDFQTNEICQFNATTGSLTQIDVIQGDFCDMLKRIGQQNTNGRQTQNIVYCSGTAKAVILAQQYADKQPRVKNAILEQLAKDIAREVHGDYYLAKIIQTGVAYHIGYLPPTIRMRIEEQFCKGNIHTIFCTSTLIEGVNLPADNLFITSTYNGTSKLKPVDLKNLVGRVGRIEFNLYGNVFLVRLDDDKRVKPEEYGKLLSEEIPEQKLSIVTALTKKQNERIVLALASGKTEFEKLSTDTLEDLKVMRKFALILLRDITKDRNSLVRREFEPFLRNNVEEKIKTAFAQTKEEIDDDINTSVDQTVNLSVEIRKGLEYPKIREDGFIDRLELAGFLGKLCEIFKWDIHESQTLGYVGKNGKHGKLEWYGVLLSQWISGNGLQSIMEQALKNLREKPHPIIYINNLPVDFVDELPHRNNVITDALKAIETVILFSISNCFLKFSSEYKRQHDNKPFSNDWYEYVEYGTTNPLSIMLLRNGFSRETANFIKDNRQQYVVTENGESKLKRSIRECGNTSVENQVKDVIFNVPELFLD
jgi:hypothetical protein